MNFPAMAINFRQLEVFRAVAETRSFTRASHLLFIAQSTVSEHIRELEETLKIRLFERNRRAVSLTAAGEKLLEFGSRVFLTLEEAEAATRAVRDPYCGKFSFGCASTTLLYQLPPVLAEYASKYPQVEVTISSGTIQEVASEMWSGALDLALVVLPLTSPQFKKLVLFEEPFVAVLPANHRLASGRKLRIADLAGERFILHRRDQNTRKLIDRFFFKNKVSPRVAIELSETEAIKEMVSRGLGVSVLPVSAFPRFRRLGKLKTFPLADPELKRTLALVYLRDKTLRAPVQAMIDLLQRHFRRPSA
jgi:DNA-binding transcriptional LysR family regulator